MEDRQEKSERLSERNRIALWLLHQAAQAISDGELDYADQLQHYAARLLRNRGVVERLFTKHYETLKGVENE